MFLVVILFFTCLVWRTTTADSLIDHDFKRISKAVDQDISSRIVRTYPEGRKYIKSTPNTRMFSRAAQIMDRMKAETNHSHVKITNRMNEELPNGSSCPITRNLFAKSPVGQFDKDGLVFQKLRCNRNSVKFRTVSGECNNFLRLRQHWGKSFNPFRRLDENTYEDGEDKPTTKNLPSAREISVKLHPDENHPDYRITLMVVNLGQFLDHDLTLTPEEDLDCCHSELKSSPRCFNIHFSKDYFYSNHKIDCLPLTRSDKACGAYKIREQPNASTSYLDLSSVYGSTDDIARICRSFKDGLLQESEYYSGSLPTAKSLKVKLKDNGFFFGGDPRANETPTLTVLHTLFLREHNRVARELKKLLSHASDEHLYQLARKIVIGQWQHIVYNEFLPLVLGPKLTKKFYLSAKEDSLYFREINPMVFNSFATAAFRFGHTLIQGLLKRYEGKIERQSFKLEDHFFGTPLTKTASGIERLLEGILGQMTQSYDNFISHSVTNFLFRNNSQPFGQDLVSRNIQRGRDHGLIKYATARKICGLTLLSHDWNNRPKDISHDQWSKFQELYKSPMDIELFPAGISEAPGRESVVGATFGCLIAYQFFLVKHGDRFFFSHLEGSGIKFRRFGSSDRSLIRYLMQEDIFKVHYDRNIRRNKRNPRDNSGQYSESQKKVIRSRKLSDIICDNTVTVSEVRTFAMQTPSGSNLKLKCGHHTPLHLDSFIQE